MTVAIQSIPRDGVSRETPQSAQLQMLRSHVEAELKSPAVVLVTSAHSGDGKSLTAHSLASSFVRTGHRVALISQSQGDPDGAGPARIDLPEEDGDPAWRDRLSALVKRLRADYDFTIVDPGTFLGSDAAMALGRLVDGILLAVRVGRAPSDEDELMVRAIDHCGGRIIGVVATDEEAVAEFGRSQSQPDAAARARARRPLERPPYVLPAKSLAH